MCIRDRATDGVWVSDGTLAGTTRLQQLDVISSLTFWDGILSAAPTWVDGLNKLFFVADDGINGWELWVTDGTVGGTQLVSNIHPGDSSSPTLLMSGDTYLLFSAQDSDGRAKLWKTDGSDAGTVLVSDINPGGFGNFAFFTPGG